MIVESEYGYVQIDGDKYASVKRLTATAKPGYTFFAWTGDTQGIDEYSNVVDINLIKQPYKHVYATFVKNTTYSASV